MDLQVCLSYKINLLVRCLCMLIERGAEHNENALYTKTKFSKKKLKIIFSELFVVRDFMIQTKLIAKTLFYGKQSPLTNSPMIYQLVRTNISLLLLCH